MKKIALAMENFSRFAGGAESYAVSLADTLIRNSWDVHFYGQKWDGEPQGVVFHKIYVPGFLPAALKLFVFALQHRRAVQREHFDVVLGFGNVVCMNVYQSHGGVHWLSTERYRYVYQNPLFRSVKKLMTRLSLKHWMIHWIESAPFRMRPRPKMVAISDMTRNDMVSYFPIGRDDIEVVYNGVTMKQSPEDSREKMPGSLRQRFGIPHDHVVFLFVSYNLRKKGIGPLVEAAGLLKKSGKENFSVLVVGGRPGFLLARRISRLGIGDRIFFPGPARDMDEYYAGADAFVLPTLYDACSLVVLEAMAWGLPVITTESNGAAGVIVAGENGYVIPHPPQPRALAEKMSRLLPREKRLMMSEAASRTIKDYSLERNHQNMLRIFDEVVAHNRSGSPLARK